jgi:hypothetical protein
VLAVVDSADMRGFAVDGGRPSRDLVLAALAAET